MRIAWPWLCLGAALTAWGLFPSKQQNDEQQENTSPTRSPAPLSAISKPSDSAIQFRHEMAEKSQSYNGFDELRPLGEKLSKQDLHRLLRSAPEDDSARRLLNYLLAERDPRAVLDQALTIDWEDDDKTHRLAAFAIANWAKSDPDAAEAWLKNTFGDLLKIKEYAGQALRSEMLGSLSQYHPEKALDWIRRYKITHLGGMVSEGFSLPTTAHWRELMQINPENNYWARFFEASDPTGYAEWVEGIGDQITFESHWGIIEIKSPVKSERSPRSESRS